MALERIKAMLDDVQNPKELQRGYQCGVTQFRDQLETDRQTNTQTDRQTHTDRQQ